jgi:tight adherence protein C
MAPVGILGILFVSLFLVVFSLLLISRRFRDPTVKRLKDLNVTQPGSGTNNDDEKDEGKGLNEKAEKVLSFFGRMTKQDAEKVSQLRKNLIQAGHYSEESVKIFVGLKILSSIVFFVFFIYLGLLGNRPFFVVILLSLLVAMVGNKLPDMILNFQIRKRQENIAASLPDALDLLVISVEAGLGLNAALLRVGEDMVMRCPALSEEFIRVNQDLRTGVTRADALRNLTERNKVEDLKIFVGALILADRLGTSIGDTLRAQADSLRTRISQKAEEQAARAGIKLLFPLILFILPALIIILMGPGLISVYRTFRP